MNDVELSEYLQAKIIKDMEIEATPAMMTISSDLESVANYLKWFYEEVQ